MESLSDFMRDREKLSGYMGMPDKTVQRWVEAISSFADESSGAITQSILATASKQDAKITPRRIKISRPGKASKRQLLKLARKVWEDKPRASYYGDGDPICAFCSEGIDTHIHELDCPIVDIAKMLGIKFEIEEVEIASRHYLAPTEIRQLAVFEA